MVTRRILQRQLRLRPEEPINHLLLYMLVVAAEKYGVKIHCFQFLSNHIHVILTYTKKRLPRFMQLAGPWGFHGELSVFSRWEIVQRFTEVLEEGD